MLSAPDSEVELAPDTEVSLAPVLVDKPVSVPVPVSVAFAAPEPVLIDVAPYSAAVPLGAAVVAPATAD